ncbi:two-component system osmolarity sensor histidine kinase EnvZ [Constrictibacter sp. MBR-5]|jgi:two-component system osmolarity sensor histidine kinase EnvZ|uniref:ATP-binding protein n=1 Tax=Constrictibacter sp. MBR-5 TaxID=3156467 RepID=UPI00339B3774
MATRQQPDAPEDEDELIPLDPDATLPPPDAAPPPQPPFPVEADGAAGPPPRRKLLHPMNRALPRTLFGRSLLIIVTPLVLLQVIATWIFFDRHWDIVSKRLAQAVAGDISVAIDMIDRAADEPTVAAILETLSRSANLYATIEQDAILPGGEQPWPDHNLGKKLTRAMNDQVRRPFRLDTETSETFVMIDVQLPHGVLHVIVPRSRLFTTTTYIFILWMVGSSLVLVAVAGIFMRKQIRPIIRLAAAADAFGKGRDVTGFRVTGAVEVKQAASAFLIMRERIRRQIQQRTELLAGVSHDLRTPITRMKLQLALLRRSPAVVDLEADLKEMETMLNGYLAFARGDGEEATVPVDIAALLTEVAESARRAGGTVTLDTISAETAVPLRPNAMRRALDNLVGNGQRHGGRVWLGTRRARRQIEIWVDDDGPGIPAGERENVFRPFYRLEASRNPGTGGTGLGLSIARDIVRGHGGDVRLEDSPRGGLRARVLLPCE